VIDPRARHGTIGARSRVTAIGVAQTIAWGSSFYLPAMLAPGMASAFGRSASDVFGLLSIALLLAALVSPAAGRLIDRHGGRPVLLVATLLFVAGLVTLAAANHAAALVAGWLLLGVAMGCGLYDAAFAALVRLLGREARRSISGITLIAGFASSVGWPLSAWMQSAWGWRGACLGWAALHLLVALPLYLWSLPKLGAAEADAPGSAPAAMPAPSTVRAPDTAPTESRRPALALLMLLFVCWSFVSGAVATHLPALLLAAGVPVAGAVAMAALAGPSQVAARLLELSLLSRRSPLLSARLAGLGHPLAAGALLLLGPWAAVPFVVLHGLGNGLLTIVRGTLPLALFGPAGYGARQGFIALPGRLLGAASPWLFGLLIEARGVQALWLTAALGGAGLVLLWMLRLPHDSTPR
jgi:predicted MFS family arabinose efflux permease